MEKQSILNITFKVCWISIESEYSKIRLSPLKLYSYIKSCFLIVTFLQSLKFGFPNELPEISFHVPFTQAPPNLKGQNQT